MSSSLEIQLISIIISVACSLPGAFLVLRKMSMMTDSITHTILLGIVLAFFLTEDLNSPFLIIGATLMGVITVWLTETLTKTKLLSADSAIGIVFPLLFSIAIILMTRFADATHLCVNCVLLGELAFAPFNRMIIFGIDIGAKALYTGGILLILNIVFIVLLFKELKIATFDPMLASVMGLSPVVIHYLLMTMVSLTAVGSFETVGSILVIAFMIAPPVTAYLLTDNLKIMLILSAIFGAISGVLGYNLAYILDVSIAGSIAIILGIIFFIVFIIAPKRGLACVLLRKRKQKMQFAQTTLYIHIYNHQDTKAAFIENGIGSICNHLQWTQNELNHVLKHLFKNNTIELKNSQLWITQKGIEIMNSNIKDYIKIN